MGQAQNPDRDACLRRPRLAHSAAERNAESVSAARASSRAAISSLLMGGQSSTPVRGDEMDLRVVAAHGAGPRPDVVGDDPVGSLGAALGGGVLDQVLGLGGKADDEARPLGAGLGDGRQNVGVLRELELRPRRPRVPSSASAAPRRRRANRRRRRRKWRCRREARQARRPASHAPSRPSPRARLADRQA